MDQSKKIRIAALVFAVIAVVGVFLPMVTFDEKPEKNVLHVITRTGGELLWFWPVIAMLVLAALCLVLWVIPKIRPVRIAVGILTVIGAIALTMVLKKTWFDSAAQIFAADWDRITGNQIIVALDLKFGISSIVVILGALGYTACAVMEKPILARDILRDKYLYLLLLPGIAWFIIFNYLPMYGIQIAFKDFVMTKGIEVSEWIGFTHFQQLFGGVTFQQVLMNTLTISVLKLVCSFPAPIILSLLLNEVRQLRFKKFVQTVLYLPHFISWVILGGLLQNFLHPTYGFINEIVKLFGGQSINFLGQRELFRGILIISDIYKGMGWGTIVYLAALSGVDVEQYEAAVVDGANKLQQMWHITLPAIRSVVVVLFILQLGNILSAGFDQVFNLYSPAVYSVADIIDTYVYRQGMVQANYSYATAAGLFKSLVALVLVVITNYSVRLFGETGLW